MSTSQIFDDWSTYEKVVAGDYMHHCDFFDVLMDEIAARLSRPLAIIDIGCGDARPILPLLERFEIKRYVGIDQSQVALDRAHKALIRLSISYELQSGSMLGGLRNMAAEFDLAIASYSLHHLESCDKQATITECRRLLRPDALLAVIDVFLEEGESRPAYFERWQKNARETFASLKQGELEALLEHVHDCDIPETVSSYREFGIAAGFATVEPIREDRERLNKLVMFC